MERLKENSKFNNIMIKRMLIVFLLCITAFLQAQTDTIKYSWPVQPLNSSHGINGTFCEFRNTLSSDHFHNAVDIGKADGEPVYACLDGVVYSKSTNGYNSYVNVKTTFGFQKKHITYYHVKPNPSLDVGDHVTAGVTVVGTIADGAGHVHLIERELINSSSSSLGTEINPIRKGGGLTPYNDNYTPVIHSSSLEFRRNNSSTKVDKNNLTGKVDIIIKVVERNGSYSSQTNNGTYLLGYRIWNADTTQIIYEPPDGGVKYKFDRKPLNEYVHKVFVKGIATLSNPVYWLTNGKGESYINENLIVNDSYLDTDQFPEGNYILQVFTEDTRDNYAEKYFNISITKNPPVLLSVENPDKRKSLRVTWGKFTLKNLKGYRLYGTNDTTLQNWYLIAGEDVFTKDLTEYTFNSPSQFNPSVPDDVKYFYLTYVDSNDVEGKRSDVYSRSVFEDSVNVPEVLIVDGFDRSGSGGSWAEPSHSFNTMYFNALEKYNVLIESCANDAVVQNKIELEDYDFVIWFTGDESRAENTFENPEQGKIALYLEHGGKIVITGDDIGYDLDQEHQYSEFSDTLFYRHYLKAHLVHTGNTLLTEANGVEGTVFQPLSLQFGKTYEEDSPDDIEPVNGADSVLIYNFLRNDNMHFRKGGIAYTGAFGTSNLVGQVIYISFALETLEQVQLNEFMESALRYFGVITGTRNSIPKIPWEFVLEQNYPNPFNPSTTINYTIPLTDILTNTFEQPDNGIPEQAGKGNVKVSLVVYDILGREVATLVNKIQAPGNYRIVFEANGLSSGIYFYQLRYGSKIATKKMVLLK